MKDNEKMMKLFADNWHDSNINIMFVTPKGIKSISRRDYIKQQEPNWRKTFYRYCQDRGLMSKYKQLVKF